MSNPTSPNQAVELTPSARHAGCSPRGLGSTRRAALRGQLTLGSLDEIEEA
jgi:hypothetical protein